MQKRVAIIGSREYPNLYDIKAYLEYQVRDKNTVIVTGDADGVDKAAKEYAKGLGFYVEVYKANWGKWGERAGLVRNGEIAQNADCCVAFWDGESKGTMNTVRRFREIGKPVKVIQACNYR